MYRVKEIIYTLQGEGAHTGRAAILCRFSGCNLWSGYEADRATARCAICDTDFVGTDGPGGGQFASAAELARAIAAHWPSDPCGGGRPYVVCTGGEPLLQLDPTLIAALHGEGLEVGIETNGTLPIPDGIDWVCVSPKPGVPLVVTTGHELKLVYPLPGCDPEQFECLAFERFSLLPLVPPHRSPDPRRVIPGAVGHPHVRDAVAYCLAHPRWRLTLQTASLLGIP
ncbi:MAG: 7-carboxy-7-deazaguanine synthase [Vicinamibacterales bacterium]|nr:7-carboxy-7-deazaguanine synthase [Vicinamibacterales bacterium]